MKKPLTIQDLDEIKVWKKRQYFMDIFFEIHQESKAESSVSSLVDSYHIAEIIFVERHGAKAYNSNESFLRSYYYHLNSKH